MTNGDLKGKPYSAVAVLLAVCASAMLAVTQLVAADYPSADKDIYGNTIYTNASGAVTYQFLVSGDTQDVLSVSNSTCLASAETSALDAMFKSVWASVGGWLNSTKAGLMMIFH